MHTTKKYRCILQQIRNMNWIIKKDISQIYRQALKIQRVAVFLLVYKKIFFFTQRTQFKEGTTGSRFAGYVGEDTTIAQLETIGVFKIMIEFRGLSIVARGQMICSHLLPLPQFDKYIVKRKEILYNGAPTLVKFYYQVSHDKDDRWPNLL